MRPSARTRRRRRSGRQGSADQRQPAPRRVDRQALPQGRDALPGSHPGRQHRPHAGGRQVRLDQGLQVLHLRHVVDPPVDHPGHRRPGPHHPHPGPHGRDDQQGAAGAAPDAAGARPRADASRSWPLKLEDMSPEKVRDILKINQDTVSLEQPVGDEDDFSLSDTISDDSAEVPADYATRMMLTAAVAEALDQLSERERDIIRLRFGLDGGEMRTLEEVGKRVRRHPRARPPDRVEDPRQAAPPDPQPRPPRLPRRDRLARHTPPYIRRMGYRGKVAERDKARDLRAAGMTLARHRDRVGRVQGVGVGLGPRRRVHAIETPLRRHVCVRTSCMQRKHDEIAATARGRAPAHRRD